MSALRNMNRFVLFGLLTIGTLALVAGGGFCARARSASSDSGVLLTGNVTADVPKMEGVVVSARADGSNITTTVYTDDRGDYYFPRLDAAHYEVWAQTGGYATAHASLQLSGNSVKHQDFALVKMKTAEEMGRQMTGAEWLDSLPAETVADKRAKEILRDTCTGCHTEAMELQNRFDAKGWEIMISTMNHTGPYGNYIFSDKSGLPFAYANRKELAAYLAKVRGPESVLTPKFHPRPSGDATLAVIREYSIPLPNVAKGLPKAVEDGSDWSLGTASGLHGNRNIHDSTPDFYGNIWFSASVENSERSYGKVNIKTGQVTLFRIPGADGNALTSHQLLRDRQGNIWMNISGADFEYGEALLSSVGKVDPKTDQLTLYTVPKGMPPIGGFGDVDNNGNAWFGSGHGVVRLDAVTHEFKQYTFKGGVPVSPYGVTADINGNGWGSQFNSELEGRADGETGGTMDVQIPAPPRAARVKALFSAEDVAQYEKIGSLSFMEGIPWYNGPRRPTADRNPGGDSVWVPGWFGGTLMKINVHDYKVTQYPIPQPELDGAYDLKVDKDHNVWATFQNSDTIGKFDPKTEKWVEYRLPTLGIESHAVGLLDDKDGRTKVTATSLRQSKIAYLEFRTKQEHDALRAEVARGLSASK